MHKCQDFDIEIKHEELAKLKAKLRNSISKQKETQQMTELVVLSQFILQDSFHLLGAIALIASITYMISTIVVVFQCHVSDENF